MLPDERPQRAALDVLHRDVRRAVVLEVVVHGDDVRMAQRAGHARLAQEALRERGVGGVERRQLLERDEAVEVGLAGEVDHRHAAAPDLAEDLVAADGLQDVRHRLTSLSMRCVPRLFPSSRLRRSMARACGLGNRRHGGAVRESRDGVKLFVVDPHTIYRRGLAACLEGLPEVESVGQADERAHRVGGRGAVRLRPRARRPRDDRRARLPRRGRRGDRRGGRRLQLASAREDAVLAALQAGAVGVLRKETLTTESLASAVRAAADGTGVVTSELLRELLDGLAPDGYEQARRRAAHRPRAAGALADRRRPPDPRGRAAVVLFRAHREERAARRRDEAERPQPLAGRRARGARGAHLTSVADLLAGRRIVVCAGSGGVGKTTTAAALAMGAAAEGAKVAVVTIDPAQAAGELARPRGARQRAAADRPRALRRARRRDARRAVGADARRQAHVRRADRAPRARRAHARRGALQPHLQAALQRGRRLAGVHRDRQALRPRRQRRVRPARARHAAVAQRARLPRRARAADRLLPGPRDQGLPAPGRLRRAHPRQGHRRRVRAAAPRHRRRPARGPVGLLPRARRDDRRVRGARGPRRRAALGPRHDVPDRHVAAPRPGRGGDLLPPQAAARRGCRSAALVVNRLHVGAGARRRAAGGAGRGAGRAARRPRGDLGARAGGARRARRGEHRAPARAASATRRW